MPHQPVLVSLVPVTAITGKVIYPESQILLPDVSTICFQRPCLSHERPILESLPLGESTSTLVTATAITGQHKKP